MGTILLFAVAVLVMCCNEDMNAAYWVAVVVMVATSLKIADKLDRYGRVGKNDSVDK